MGERVQCEVWFTTTTTTTGPCEYTYIYSAVGRAKCIVCACVG